MLSLSLISMKLLEPEVDTASCQFKIRIHLELEERLVSSASVASRRQFDNAAEWAATEGRRAQLLP